MTIAPTTSTTAARAWPFVLLPDQSSAALRVDARSLAVYHEVAWRSRPVDSYEVVATRERITDGPAERLICRATDATGTVVARSTIVTIPPGPPHQHAAARCVPTPPQPQQLVRHSTLIVTPDEVRDFGARLDGYYPFHEQVTAAWSAGFTNLLVPGSLLLAIHSVPPVPAGGQISVWFTEPVAVGTALELTQDHADPEVWALVRVGDQRVVTLARRTTFDRSAEASAFGDRDGA